MAADESPTPPDAEAQRLAALARFGLMDSAPDAMAERVVALAASIAGTPMALVSLVGEDRQWFKAAYGIALSETPRRDSFCAHALGSPELLEIPDARLDARFRDNRLVTGEPYIRFYAGAPLVSREGYVIGTLCVLDRQPRALSDGQRAALRLLAELVMEHFEYAVVADQAGQQHRRLQEIILGTNAATWEWHVPSGELRSNRRWATMLGYEPEHLEPLSIDVWRRLVHPDDLPEAEAALSRHFAGSTDFFDCQLRMRHRDGDWIWVHTRGRLWSRRSGDDAPAWMSGTHLDITSEKRSEQAALSFQATLDRIRDCLFMFDTDSMRFEYVNQGACAQVGYRAEELLRMHPWDVKPEYPEPAFRRLVAPLLRGEQDSLTFETVHRTRDGEDIPVEVLLQCVRPTIGGERFVAVVRDTTERQRAEEALRLYASVFQASPDGIMITAPDHRVLDVNPAYTRATGYTREEMIGAPAEIWSDPDNAAIARAIARNGHWRGERWARRRAGAVYPEHLAVNSVHDDQGALSHFVTVLSDISHLKEYERRIRHLGLYDPLTDLPNRHLFASSLREAMAQARQRGENLGVAMLDVDRLQVFNNDMGKAAGDAVLRQIAANLERALAEGDLLARVGGDEFAVMLSGIDDIDALVARLEDLQRSVAKPVRLADASAQFTASLGATLFPLDDGDAEQLLRHASQAMYRAKQSGRDCSLMFDTDSAREAELRQQGLWRLRQALESEEFELHYQPRVDLASSEVLGLEALIRWRHPEEGLQWPGAFLPLLEGAPLEHAVGFWVLRTAIAEGASRGIPMSVNISARQLLAPGFAQEVSDLLGVYPDFPAPALELEILEDEAVYDWQAAQPVFADLRARGVRFALDDFGTGYSSLVHLRHMPVAVLKIDVGFVQRMLENSEDAAIVESVVRLARSFDLETVAEGVETEAHAERLVAMDCRVGQGFGIARPMPVAELDGWLDGRAVRGLPPPPASGSGEQHCRPV